MKKIRVVTVLLGLLVISSGLVLQVKAAAQVNLLTHSGWLDSIGYYHVTGEVENVGDGAARFAKITATFYDSSGTVVATSFQYTWLEILLPGRKSPFEVLLLNSSQAAKVHHYSLSLTSFSAADPVPLCLEILSNSSYTDTSGYMHVVGEIKNIGTLTATYVSVIATFYNSTGTVVATGATYANPKDINAGQTAPFDVLLGYKNRIPLVASYALTAQSVEYAMIPEFPATALLPFLAMTLLASAGLAVNISHRKPRPSAT